MTVDPKSPISSFCCFPSFFNFLVIVLLPFSFLSASAGVMVFSTTPTSNRTSKLGDWAVWEWGLASSEALLPYHTASETQYVGEFRQVDARCDQYPTFLAYAQGNQAPWVRLYLGYNPKFSTLDEQWYAVDMYVQRGALLGSDAFVWYHSNLGR